MIHEAPCCDTTRDLGDPDHPNIFLAETESRPTSESDLPHDEDIVHVRRFLRFLTITYCWDPDDKKLINSSKAEMIIK